MNTESPGIFMLIIILVAVAVAVIVLALFFFGLNRFDGNVIKGIAGIIGAVWAMVVVKFYRQKI